MATGQERADGASASKSEYEMREENEKLARLDQHSEESRRVHSAPEEMEMGDEQESAELLPQASEKPQPVNSSWFSTILWTSINTLATIGIVSFASLPWPSGLGSIIRHLSPTPLLTLSSKGLHQQGNLLRSVAQARPAYLCVLPLHRHLAHAVRLVTAALCLFPAAPRHHCRDPTPVRRHGT